MRYYLKRANIEYSFKPERIKKRIKFKFQKVLYGFDESDVYDLDHTMKCLLYERLIRYKKDAFKMINGSYHSIEILGIEYTHEEWVDILISLLEDTLSDDSPDMSWNDETLTDRAIWRIWQHIHPAMWW